MSIPAYCACLGSSVLSQSVEAYVGYLEHQQYHPAVIRIYLRGVEHFARWVNRVLDEVAEQPFEVPLRAIDESLTRQFLTDHLPACQCPDRCLRTSIAVRAALVHMLHVLRAEGCISEREVLVQPAICTELERFDDYLGSVCGLTVATRSSRRQWVSRFLEDLFALGFFGPAREGVMVDVAGKAQPAAEHDAVASVLASNPFTRGFE